MTPLPHRLQRNLPYLNRPKSLASPRISKDTGPGLGANPLPLLLPRPGGGSPPRHLGSRHPGAWQRPHWPGRLHASASCARLPWGDPSPAPHLADPSSLRTQLPAGAAVVAPPGRPSRGTCCGPSAPAWGTEGPAVSDRTRRVLVPAWEAPAPGGFVCPPVAGPDRAPTGLRRARPPVCLQRPRPVNFSPAFQNPFKKMFNG